MDTQGKGSVLLGVEPAERLQAPSCESAEYEAWRHGVAEIRRRGGADTVDLEMRGGSHPCQHSELLWAELVEHLRRHLGQLGGALKRPAICDESSGK